MNDAVPFVAAIVMFLVGPILTRKAKREVVTWMGTSAKFLHVNEKDLPVHLTPGHIERYVEYAADVVQIVPAVTLTIVSALVLNPGNYTPAWAAVLVVVTVVLIALLDGFVLSSPERYLRTKKWGVSVLSAVGILLNLAGLVAFIAIEN